MVHDLTGDVTQLAIARLGLTDEHRDVGRQGEGQRSIIGVEGITLRRVEVQGTEGVVGDELEARIFVNKIPDISTIGVRTTYVGNQDFTPQDNP